MKKEHSEPILLRNRRTGELQEEAVFGNKALRFFYESFLGRSFWGLLFHSSFLSALMGRYYDSALSKKNILALAATPGCNKEEAELSLEEYPSFNAFFTRKLKEGVRPFDKSEKILSSPTDGRLFVYEKLSCIDPVPVKGAKKSLNELCCGKLEKDKTYAVAVIRLAPIDYHRYHFPCSCKQETAPLRICGKYHSVNPVALTKRPDIYVENTREITTLFSETFGKFYFIEVGAFGVGSIIQSSGCGEHCKSAEKGYFKFGGSTIILIFDDKKLQWDADLLQNSSEKIETLIQCGMSLGSSGKNC